MKKEALNPFLPLHAYHPDGEPHVFGNRVYLFGSHDKENGKTFCMLDYEFWSALVDDLSGWTGKGVNYSAKQDPLSSETMQYMYAPDCVQGSGGRYYLYYCLSGDKGRGGYSNPISVAVCDTPDGKYEYWGCVRNPDGSPMTQLVCFDPAEINDEGTIRLYFGSTMPWLDHVWPRGLKNRMLSKLLGKSREAVEKGVLGFYHVTLADDMLTVTSEPRHIDDSISGAVCAFLYDTVCGIRVSGERRFTVAPQPGGTLTQAEASWLSPYGEVKSRWEKTENRTNFEIEIPSNATATITLPDGKTETVNAGRYRYEI